MPDKKTVTAPEVAEYIDTLPETVRTAMEAMAAPAKVEDLFPKNIADQLTRTGVANLDNNRKIGVITSSEGYVQAVAATVPRAPSHSYDIVKDIKEFSITRSDDRAELVQYYHSVYKADGMVNNAINKTAALVGADGEFFIQRARKGKRKVANVEDELLTVLNYWKKHVNARAVDSAVTGARGLEAICNQATRQALIEGSWIGYIHEKNVDIASLGKSYKLPMFLQSMSTRYITIPDGLVGTGLELFLWQPPRSLIAKLTNPNDKVLKKIYDDAFAGSDLLKDLKANGKAVLDKERVLHVKHRALDIEGFGESFVAPIISDLAYKRTLQALDFVTIDSLINRLMIIKVGSDNPESEYHNLEFAQKRLALLQRMFNTTDPSMTLLWAGPDIDVVDIGVHGKIAELDGRYATAHERQIFAMGVPKPLLIGEGVGQNWVGYEGYKETLKELQNNFAQMYIALGERIAVNNGFDGVELTFEFDRSVLADQTASADLALRVRKSGLSSIRKSISDLGGDYEAERRNRLIERGFEGDEESTTITDEELFMAPRGMPGDTQTDIDGNVSDPGGEGGRPPDSQREDLGPERDPQKKSRKKPEDEKA